MGRPAEIKDAKSSRLLELYVRLLNGEVLKKDALAQQYHITERSVQRDIVSLRCFLSEQMLTQRIDYDTQVKGYRLTDIRTESFTDSEILAVCKILLESRSMRKDEMLPILDKLVRYCVPIEKQSIVGDLLANEKYHYIEPHHGKPILDGLWEIGQAIKCHQVMEIEYGRMKEPTCVKRRIQPVGLMFSEYYFYLTAFLEDKSDFDNPDDLFPTIYRIDRIRSFRVLDERFQVPYASRFEEGEFRKRVQFMYGGKLERIKFRYTGPSLEAVLDRLPTAEIVSTDDDGWTIQAEVFGKGIDMWLRSQGDYVRLEDINYGIR